MKAPDEKTPAPRILLVEDEPKIRRFLRASLEAHGFSVDEAETGKAALASLTLRAPDAVLLDLGLPDMDGLELTRQVRSWSAVPIVVVSARGTEEDKVRVLDAGADDYLTKPFGTAELLARIRVALRHAQANASDDGDGVFETRGLKVDRARRQVFVDGREVRLTPTEWRLLALLVKHAGKVLTHPQILREVWGPPYVGETQYLRVYFGQLRRKLEADPAQPKYLRTEPGVGYRLAVDAE